MFLLILLQPFLQPHFLNSLNSIMFLLIQKLKNISTGEQTALNSIMFLLIRLALIVVSIQHFYFKFHYVSINSVYVLPKLSFSYSL